MILTSGDSISIFFRLLPYTTYIIPIASFIIAVVIGLSIRGKACRIERDYTRTSADITSVRRVSKRTHIKYEYRDQSRSIAQWFSFRPRSNKLQLHVVHRNILQPGESIRILYRKNYEQRQKCTIHLWWCGSAWNSGIFMEKALISQRPFLLPPDEILCHLTGYYKPCD